MPRLRYHDRAMRRESTSSLPRSSADPLLLAASVLWCSACEQAPTHDDLSELEASTIQTTAAPDQGSRARPPDDTRSPKQPAGAAVDPQPPVTSPFLVGNPSPAPPSPPPSPLLFPPSPPSPPPPSPPPPPRPPPSPQSCGPNRCLLHGRCVIPGGHLPGPNTPPGAISGVCGHGGKCFACRCASPDALIATPKGNVFIESIQPRDEVFSLHRGTVAVVPVLTTQRVPVRDHAVARVRLGGGAVIEVSGEHPMADGRALFDLRPGERIGQVVVEALSLVPYEFADTYDILPDSDSGAYLVSGLWLASTISSAKMADDIEGPLSIKSPGEAP